ncbi:TPA: hypothetical protein ROY21_005132 [Bacillus cereus]|nr:hypothetical protein [Bacillus cereus]
MAGIRFSENFVEEFEEIAKETDKEVLKGLLKELKKVDSKIDNIDINPTYVRELKNFSQIDDDGYIYKFDELRLVCLLENQELRFIGISTVDKIREMFRVENDELE